MRGRDGIEVVAACAAHEGKDDMGTQLISEPELDRANHAKDASASVCELLAGELEPPSAA